MSATKTKNAKLAFTPSSKRVPALLAAGLRNDGTLGPLIEEQSREDGAKMLLLCQYFDIQSGPNMFYELALALAQKLYPEHEKRGRKVKWTDFGKGILVAEVERITRTKNATRGVTWACKQLAKTEPWKSFLDRKDSSFDSADPAEALRKTYYGFKCDRWAAVFRDALKLHQANDNLKPWNALVDEIVK